MEKKLKLIWFTSYPAPYRTEFYKLLANHFELVIIHEKQRYSERNNKWFSDDYDNYKVYYLNSKSNFISKCKLLYSIIKDNDVKYIFNSSYTQPYGMLLTRLSKILKKKVILEADGGIPNKNKIIKLIVYNEFKKYDYFMSSSKYTDEYFRYYGVKEDLIHRFNFTSLTKDDIIKNHTKEKKYDSTFKVISIGQMVPRKGFDILIKALALVDNINCKIIGGLPNKEIITLVNDLNLKNVEFIDFLKKEELANYYKDADLFVFPTREDIWGLVINESLSFNLPFLSSNNCVAAKHFLDIAKCGMLFENEDINDLANKIIEIKNNNKLLMDLRQNTSEAIKHSTIEQMVKDHVDFIVKIDK